MLLLARLLLGEACALAAPAAHARSWVMTPDPAETLPESVSFSAVDLPPEVIGLGNEQHSLSVHFQFTTGFCTDCETAVHFDQPASRAWGQHDPPCFDGVGELGPGQTGTRSRNTWLAATSVSPNWLRPSFSRKRLLPIHS